ncbi:MAG: Ppx/GppA family phosphatase [Bdellovibrionales bacterium]|nr:Ppx/GppA family phosphatase [Bdellovibrionales bacterium]
MKVAALDLGSNTFLLLLCEFRNGELSQVFRDETEVVRLAQGVDKTQRFSEEALGRAEECLARYAELIQEFKAEKVLAVATSAARDAQNKQDFLAILNRHNIPLKIIEGSIEAQLTFQGATFDQNPHIPFVVVDVGGGSTEIIGGHGKKAEGVSVNVGSVRLTERILSQPPHTEKELRALRKTITEELEKNLSNISFPEAAKIIGVAGTPTTLACLEKKISFDESQIHGHVIKSAEISQWVERLSQMGISDRDQLPGMPPRRSDVLVAGAAILEGVLKYLGQEELTVSTKGVRYGLAGSLAQDTLS